MTSPPRDFSRLCIHTMTTKPWAFEEAVRRYAAAGVAGVTVWRSDFADLGPAAAGELVRSHGLSVVSLCRGGFFPADSAGGRARAVDDNLRCIDEAAALGAPHVVLVCGSAPGLALAESRRQIAEGIAAVLPHAAASGVKLAIEPLHPMYAADRSAVSTMSQARAICSQLKSPWLGIAVDVYHTWWDDRLEDEIRRSGSEGTLLAFHISDWRTPVADILEDRGVMGEGCIPIRQIRGWVQEAGFDGFNEVEIFSRRHWASEQARYLEGIKAAYLAHS
ncbi:MAG TPA: sugar phosphate isomerase/epimerase family protein [Opitutaceae bacterium]|nr:sugar phosphate isomerase/epimerase family protein [Opitutaceae bacterium]